ncbi:HlyD family efflux transporter periplasmic adaptor subunit [soil metagenome]
MPEIIEQQSQEVQEILSRPPSWMLRWGLTILLSIIILLLIISSFISYPDIITAPITITSDIPPVSLIAQSSGKIDSLLVREHQNVISGEAIAVIQNPADFSDVQELKIKLDSLRPAAFLFDTSIFAHLTVSLPSYHLGDFQNVYEELGRIVAEFKSFLEVKGYQQKVKALNDQRNALEIYYTKYKQQNATLDEDLSLAKIKLNVDSGLFASGAIAKLEYNASQSTYLQKKYNYQSAESQLSQTTIQIASVEKEKTSLVLEFEKEQAQNHNELRKAYEALSSQIMIWEQHYVLKSPINGTVALFNLTKNAQVNAGDEVVIITPLKQGNTIGTLKLPIYGSAKVKEGQEVNIKLANYPYEDYGQLIGIIKSISVLPKDSSYLVIIEFPNGMITNIGKRLDVMQQMLGTGEIVTEKKSILGRIMGKLISIGSKVSSR